jgi:hypothetical protein
MIIVGAILLVMVVTSAMVVSACMLSSQANRKLEQSRDVTMKMSDHWAGSSFSGQYAGNIPHFNFEPEELEGLPGTRRF